MKGNPLKDQNPQEWKSQTSGPFLSFENINAIFQQLQVSFW